MKKSVIGLTLGLFALFFAFSSSTAWAAGEAPDGGAAPHTHALSSVEGFTGEVNFETELRCDGTTLYVGEEEQETKNEYNTGDKHPSVTGYKLPAGNYYLSSDLDINNPLIFSDAGAVNLCLNGHTITLSGKQLSVMYLVNGTALNLTDCSEGKTGTITGGKTTSPYSNLSPGLSYYTGGGIYIYKGTLNMFGGNITGNSTFIRGGGIYNDQGTVNLYGGTITENHAYEGEGGGIYNANGTLNIRDSVISKNTAKGQGGGMYIYESAFDMSGGEVSGNEAESMGGGIYLNSWEGDSFLHDVSIVNNTATSFGGGLYIDNASSLNVRVHNCIIKGNSAGTSGAGGGGIHLSWGVKLYLDGGEITGNKGGHSSTIGAGILVYGKLYVSGAPIVYDNLSGGTQNNIYLSKVSQETVTPNYLIQIEDGNSLKPGAKLGFYKNWSGYTYPSPLDITNGQATAEDLNYFVPDNEYYYIYLEGNTIKQQKFDSLHKHGGTVFNKVLPASATKLSDSNYYLTDDVTLENTVEISGDVNICLNTHTLTGPGGKAAFNVPGGAKLALVNADSTKKEYTGGTVTVGADGTVTFEEQKHKHGDIEFAAFPQNPTTLSTGYYYLTKDTTLSATVTIEGTVNICLNGFSLSFDGPAGGQAFTVPGGAVLNIYNDERPHNFFGLSGSGGIQVDVGGELHLIGETPAGTVSYAPVTGSGGTVTVDTDGTVTKPSGGEGALPDVGDHKEGHPDPTGKFTPINAVNFSAVTQANRPDGYTGLVPDELSAYRFLSPGSYYLQNDFKMSHALIAWGNTNFCLNGSNLGADNDTWIYEMQHVFWVPEKAVLNVLDCQRDLHIVWLYGGRVFLKNGGILNIKNDALGFITTIEMDSPAGGDKVAVNRDNTITLPVGAKLTQKMAGKPDQVITNNSGVLEMAVSGSTTQITPPGSGGSVNLKLPQAVSGEQPGVVLEVPAGSTVQAGTGLKATLKALGLVAADGTVNCPVAAVAADGSPAKEVLITAPEGQTLQLSPRDTAVQAPAGSTVKAGENKVEVTMKEQGQVEPDGTVSCPGVVVTLAGQTGGTAITAPAGGNVQVDVSGSAKAPAGSTVQVNDVAVSVEEAGGPGAAVTVSPSGGINLPAGSRVSASNPKKDSAAIVIALPDDGAQGTLGITDKGVAPPPGSQVSAKTREGVTIVIALPNPGGSLPEITFHESGALVLPEGTTVTKDGATETVTGSKNILNPDTGEINGPVNPNEPAGTPEVLQPDDPVTTDNGTVIERKPDDTITITPTDETKPSVVITPKNPTTPPKVDDNGKVFIDDPFEVAPDNGPTITADSGGSVDPDGNVTGKTVTVAPDGQAPTKITAPDGDAVKVSPQGDATVPAGSQVEQGKVKVEIDRTPENRPVTVKPDGALDLPSGSQITITDPTDPDKGYTVTTPQGGQAKPNPDGTVTLPPNAKVTGPDGTETTISSSGGSLDPSSGLIEGAGSSSGGGPGGNPGGNTPGGNPGGGDNPDEENPESYTISASASIGGSISPCGQVAVEQGADQTFLITPEEGYEISSVLVDSQKVGRVASYTFQNVQSGHTIQALFVAEGMAEPGHQGDCPKDDTCPIWPYTDGIPTAWYHDGVHYCIEKGLMVGTAPALWEPGIHFSRAMMAQVLYNKAGNPPVSGDGVFDDVPRQWYWPAITWGARHELLLGYGDGRFGPRDPITREQLAALLWRFSGRPQNDGQLDFTDADKASGYARQALAWASRHGVIYGYSDGSFRPQDCASRAEAAQMIMHYFNL